MKKFTLTLAAAVVGAAAMAALDADVAWAKAVPPSTVSFHAPGIVKQSARSPVFLVNWVSSGLTQMTITCFKVKGLTTHQVLASIVGAPDPRTLQTSDYPRTFANNDSNYGVIFGYGITQIRLKDDDHRFSSTVNAYVVDEDGVVPFSFVWKKYDAVTNRLSGTFSGSLLPGDSNDSKHRKNVKITKGVINAIVNYPGG